VAANSEALLLWVSYERILHYIGKTWGPGITLLTPLTRGIEHPSSVGLL
jgi:hypothetical protein